MDYREIIIEGDKVTMSAEAFAKIESRLQELEDKLNSLSSYENTRANYREVQ